MQLDKIIKKMRLQPNGLRPQELDKVLKYYGYYVSGQKGSHKQYRHKTKRPITVVQENPADRYIVNQVLEIVVDSEV